MTLWQWVFVLAVGIVGVALVVWAVWPVGGVSVLSRGRHRRKWWGRHSPEAVQVRRWVEFVEAYPSPLPPRCSSDDWHADPLTVPIPIQGVYEQQYQSLVAQRHTSPSESLRGSYEVDCPIYAGLAKEFGYDLVRGFDFTTGLVAA